MAYILTIDGHRRGATAGARVIARVKSAVLAVATHRYVHLAVIGVGMTLATLTLVGVSFNIAFNHPQQHIVGRSVAHR